jgi:hypothetical protein
MGGQCVGLCLPKIRIGLVSSHLRLWRGLKAECIASLPFLVEDGTRRVLIVYWCGLSCKSCDVTFVSDSLFDVVQPCLGIFLYKTDTFLGCMFEKLGTILIFLQLTKISFRGSWSLILWPALMLVSHGVWSHVWMYQQGLWHEVVHHQKNLIPRILGEVVRTRLSIFSESLGPARPALWRTHPEGHNASWPKPDKA